MDCSTLTCVLNVTDWILVQTLDLEDSLNQWYLKICMIGIMSHNKCECYEEEVQPYQKTDYKPIIYIRSREREILLIIPKGTVLQIPAWCTL